jgi:hypothetical protein
MWARESKGDHTQVEGWSPWQRLYNAPEGYEILGMENAEPTDHKFEVNRATTAMRAMTVHVDRSGNDAGSHARVELDWKDTSVRLRPLRNPNAPAGCALAR